MAEHNEIGKKGEEIAVAYLKKKGYFIIEQNWRYGHLELDIIAKTNAMLAIIEVKTRTSNALYDPAISVNRLKQKQLIRAANRYIQQHNISNEVRFDIISILLEGKQPIIEHLEDAFYPTL